MERTHENNHHFNVAEITISYQPKVKPSDRTRVTTSREAEQILREQWNSNTLELFEEFKILLLNRANRVLGNLQRQQGWYLGHCSRSQTDLCCGAEKPLLPASFSHTIILREISPRAKPTLV